MSASDTGRRPILAGNWKMNMLRAEAVAFCHQLGHAAADHLSDDPVAGSVDVVIFPPAVLIDSVVRAARDTPIACGGQDLHPAASGAHTGDLSAAHLLDAGCLWALCGHSERRSDHGEGDALVGRKAAAAFAAGLRTMACLGETRDERRAGSTFDVLDKQLEAILDHMTLEDIPSQRVGSHVAIAYEPVWAIGTGETATPEIAQEAHAFLRQQLTRRLGIDSANGIRLLYGGSAKPENVESLYAQADIDGFLVGGASLDRKSV